MPGLSHHTLVSRAIGHDVGYVVWTPPDYSREVAAIERAARVWKKNGFGLFLVNGDSDRPDAFKDFVAVLEAQGIDHEVLILPDTEHNLGLYYERSANRMLALLGRHLTKP